jgi:redox-sensitive bicupin YhaK (pirin superfamily)
MKTTQQTKQPAPASSGAATTLSQPAVTVRRSGERGHAEHGWLDSRHTFSFADYYDPSHMNFRSLRVINEDYIAPGMGFGMHPHRDMEIFSYVLGGALQHKDSLGNGSVLKPGQIQLMSAGTGVLHSEFNPLRDQQTHILQIWIMPEKKNLTPGYTEWTPSPEQAAAPKVLVISPDGRDQSAVIHQDADVWRIKLDAGQKVAHELVLGRGAWLQVARGKVRFAGTELSAGDAASVEAAGTLEIVAEDDAEALLFDRA